MLFEYFKSNKSTITLPTTATTTTRSHLITFKKCPALNQYNKRCGCFCFYNHTSCFVAKRKPTTKQCCLYALALRRKIRKTSRRKRKYRRRHHAIVVINNRHYNNNDDDDDDVDVNNNNKTKEKKIDNETVKYNNTNCVNITKTTTATTTTTTSSIKCKQNVNNTKRKTFSCSLKTKKKTIKQCHNNSKSKGGSRCMCESSIANIKSISSTSCSCKNNTNCSSKNCCSSSSGGGSVKNNCCSCKMNLIVKNLVTLLLPKITVARQTATHTTIITSKLAHTIPAAPKATIKCLRECCTMATATPTAATPRLLTVQNNVRENILNNATTTTRTTTETKNVQLHATKENMRQQHQHQHQHQHQLKYLNALGKCVNIVTKQQQKQQQQHVNKTSSSSSTNTLPLYQQQQTTAKIQTSSPTFTENKTKISTPSSSLASSSLLSSSSPAAAAAPLLPSSSFSSSSFCTWYRHSNSSSSRNTNTSSRLARLIAPTRLLNELYGAIFMTLLVLSICHNNVLETSAASVKISRREILAAPAYVSASVSVSASTPRVVKQAIMPSGEAESPFNQRQHSPEQISQAKAQSYFSQDEQPHQPLEQDKRRETVDERAMEAEMEMETDNSNNILQPQYLPTYQQHYQQHHYQEEQMQQQQQQQQHHLTTMATTTTTTSFSHGMALETTYNHTFQSLSIIDGDLAVAVVDTSHQNLMTVEEEMLMAAAGGAPGVGSSSLSLDDFQLHDNVLSSYDATSTGLDGAAGIEFTHRHAVANSMPIFDFGMPRNITARTGHTEAVIKCRVDRLDDKSVSWIRKRDLHILTVGTATYTSDKRFQVTESKDSREWTLHVKSPQARDSGIYECQVNTEPKMSMAFQLNVIEISPDAKAVITGPADLHFKVGSAIILTCIVHQPSVKDIGPIYWYRGEYMITPFDINDNNHDESAGAGIDDTVTQNKVNVLEQNQHLHSHTHHQHNAGIYGGGTGANVGGGGGGGGSGSGSSTTATDAEQQPQILTNEITQDFAQRIAMESQLGDTMKSRLRISNAQTSDTGNYTCQPTTASSASVMVHVINDENPAAMQKSGANSNNNTRQENLIPLLSATLLLTIASAMASLLNMVAPARVRAPAIRNGNEWWLSTAITTALLAKTIPTMRFTIEIIKSYIMAMLSYHLNCDVISMLHGIDLIQQEPQQQQQAQLIVVMLLQSRHHELWWNYYSKRPCYRIHNNILRNSYANNNNNNNGKYFMQNGGCLCIIVVIRGHLVSHPAYDIISYNGITVTDTVTDSVTDTDRDNDTATDTTLTALYCVAEDLCRISVEPAYESLRGLQYANNQH